jgi:hypothetical protein
MLKKSRISDIFKIEYDGEGRKLSFIVKGLSNPAIPTAEDFQTTGASERI